jgi:phage replication O-like protein O
MASPQLEKGYTRLSNELLEAIVKTKLNGTQSAIVFALIRATYGWHTKSRTLGLAFFAVHTGRNKRKLGFEINKLIERNILFVEKEHSVGRSRELKLNKDYESWLDEPRVCTKRDIGYVPNGA